jgi:protein ImuB
LPIDRLTRAGLAPPDRPFALYAKSGASFVLTAVDRRAAHAGLSPGRALADARAIRPDIVAAEADPEADAALLDRIGAYCERFTPTIVLDPPDGLFLEVAGCAHLFDGEAAMAQTARATLKAQGFSAVNVAIADTPGAAWAFSRYAPTSSPDGDLLTLLSPLPVAALRLDAGADALLDRFGLRTIGQILHAPRAPFTARAGQNAMRRLDQALGRVGEALIPRRPPPPLFAMRRLMEPVLTLDGVLQVVEDLCADLADKLEGRGYGVRRLGLLLFGVDGKTRSVRLGISRLETVGSAMMRLLKERLSAQAETFEAEFGFEAARLEALELAPLAPHAVDLDAAPDARDIQAEARLVDALAARLGQERVSRLEVRAVHAPERASGLARFGPIGPAPSAPPTDGIPRRPLTLLPSPEPIEALATVPDGPPLRFRWRRVQRNVARAEGPERIAPNWLAASDSKTRDYYRIEDEAGRRYWLYREGFYDAPDPPRWYMHGVFG